MKNHKSRPLTEAERDGQIEKIIKSDNYQKAYLDESFLMSDAAREVRILSEYVKAETSLKKRRVLSTIIVFGSARILPPEKAEALLAAAEKRLTSDPDSAEFRQEVRKAKEQTAMSVYYEQARRFAEMVSSIHQTKPEDPEGLSGRQYVICTGGGPGIMEAANRGAADAGSISIGLNITLPHEQRPNPYITPDLCFQFHYFAVRKLHFLLRAVALVAFPGGFGTFDELFEGLTLRQTGKMQRLPIVLFGEDFWRKTVNFQNLVDTGMISPEDLNLFHFVNTPEEAMEAIIRYYAYGTH